jgi:glycolate oxidase iron-sulfur subunit
VVLRLRWYITTQDGLGFFKALLFRQLVWRKWPITLAAMIIGLCQRLFFGIGPNNPVRYFFPLFGFAKRRNFPTLALWSAQSRYPETIPAKNGPRIMRVGYFTGCAGNLIYTKVVKSVVDILTGYEIEVVIPKQQKCNGTPALSELYIHLQKNVKREGVFDLRQRLLPFYVVCSMTINRFFICNQEELWTPLQTSGRS